MLGTYGTLKGIGMVIGAVGMSLIATKVNLKAAALTTLVLVTVGGFGLSLTSSATTLLWLGLAWGIVVGLQWTAYATLAMSITDLRIAGVDVRHLPDDGQYRHRQRRGHRHQPVRRPGLHGRVPPAGRGQYRAHPLPVFLILQRFTTRAEDAQSALAQHTGLDELLEEEAAV